MLKIKNGRPNFFAGYPLNRGFPLNRCPLNRASTVLHISQYNTVIIFTTYEHFAFFYISQHKKVLPIDVAEVMHSDLRRRVVKFVKPFKEFQAWMARGSKGGSDQPASPDEVGYKNILFYSSHFFILFDGQRFLEID